MRAVGILTLAGTPSFVLCFLWHICMAGHMQHRPYPLYQWISDVGWMACFTSVFVFSLRMNAKRQVLFWAGSIFLILSRIGLGSCGGGNIFIELPLLVALDIYAIQYLLRPERFARPGEPAAPSNRRPPASSPASSEVRG
jgi:hypothetical protein